MSYIIDSLGQAFSDSVNIQHVNLSVSLFILF